MPRDGSNVYHQPFPNVVTATPIESTVYNGFTNDVAQDLNAPRPISAGGTGATTAYNAMIALGGEVANQLVTNYDSFAFVAGSFYSAPGATSAPASGPGFSGLCLPFSDPNYMTLEATSYEGATPRKYRRQKVAGVWSAWLELAGSLTDVDARYVNVSGDTMTGSLTANTFTTAFSASSGTLYFGTNGVANNKYLTYDGTVYTLSGGLLNVNNGGIFASMLSINVPSLTFNLRLGETTGGWSKGIRVVNSGNLEIINSANTNVIASLTDVGAFNIAGSYQIAGNPVAAAGGSYVSLFDGSQRQAILLGGTGDATNYYRNTTHSFQNVAGGTQYATLSSTGLNVTSGTLTTTVGSIVSALNVHVSSGNGYYYEGSFVVRTFWDGSYIHATHGFRTDGQMSVGGGAAITGNLSATGTATITGTIQGGTIQSLGETIGGTGYRTRNNGTSGPYGGNQFNFFWNATFMSGWIDTSNIGNVSDPRLKHMIEPLDEVLPTIKKLETCTFRYRDIGIYRDDGKRRPGLLSTNIHEHLPGAIEMGTPDEVTEEGHPLFNTLAVLPLIAVLVKGIQELTARVEALEAE